MSEFELEQSSSWLELSADQTSAESFTSDGISMDTLNQTQIDLDSSTISNSGLSDGFNSLRSSRRRVQKHSAVVLNSDKMRQFSADGIIDCSDKNKNTPKNKDHFIAKIKATRSPIVMPLANSTPNDSVVHKQSTPMQLSENEASKLIILWYRLQKVRKCMVNNFSPSCRSRIHSLILGHRVRVRMQSLEVKQLISAQKDILRVLSDLIIPKARLFSPREIIQNPKEFVPSNDISLARSLATSLLGERQKLLNHFFLGSRWVISDVNKPGFWKLASKYGKTSPSAIAFSPERQISRTIQQETPPHLKSAISSAKVPKPFPTSRLFDKIVKLTEERSNKDQSNKDKTHFSDRFNEAHKEHLSAEDSSKESKSPSKLKALKMANAFRNSKNSQPLQNPTSELFSSPHSRSNHHPLNHLAERIAQSISSTPPSSAHAGIQASPGASTSPPQSKRGGHIQVEIFSGEKLIHAKKGASQKDPADRIPCLRVAMWMPATTVTAGTQQSSGSRASPQPMAQQGLKRVFLSTLSFEEMTQNPQWDAKVMIPLPLPRSVFQEYSGDLDYDRLLRRLCDWWASGRVLLEVLDGERFNQEIFMGQCVLSLASLGIISSGQKEKSKTQTSWTIVNGSYQLERREGQVSDRVSGSVSLRVTIHPPSADFLKDHLEKIRSGQLVKEKDGSVGRHASASSAASASPVSDRALFRDESFADPWQRRDYSRNSNYKEEEEEEEEGTSAAQESEPAMFSEEVEDEPNSVDRSGIAVAIAERRSPPRRAEQHARLPRSASSNFMRDLTMSLEKVQLVMQQLSSPQLEDSANIRLPVKGARLLPEREESTGASAAERETAAAEMMQTPVSSSTKIPRPRSVSSSHQRRASLSSDVVAESRDNTRRFLESMSQQLESLSGVQTSANEVVDTYSKLLVEKQRAKATSSESSSLSPARSKSATRIPRRLLRSSSRDRDLASEHSD